MKLELKHLAPYIPYKLKVFDDWEDSNGEIFEVNSFCQEYQEWVVYDNMDGSIVNYSKDILKPILIPLSDLFNGNYEDILDEFSEVSLEAFKVAFLSELKPLDAFDKINYTIAVKLFENHFDIFGLIEQNLAIDINDLNK